MRLPNIPIVAGLLNARDVIRDLERGRKYLYSPDVIEQALGYECTQRNLWLSREWDGIISNLVTNFIEYPDDQPIPSDFILDVVRRNRLKESRTYKGEMTLLNRFLELYDSKYRFVERVDDAEGVTWFYIQKKEAEV